MSLESQARPLADVVRQFTPNWFTVTMGTGVLALALNQFPVEVPGLRQAAIGLWEANIGLFSLFTLLYGARWLLFPHEARRIFAHPVMSMFFGAIPMGLATIINGFIAFGPAVVGPAALPIAHALWWVDAGLSLFFGMAVPYLMFTRQRHGMEDMTAVWLLPIVACEVAAASGGLLAPHLAAGEALLVVVLGYILWACSVPLAMSILVLLFLRLVLHKLPEREMGVSAWLALGPIGTGALCLLLLGQDAPAIFAARGLGEIGQVARGVGIVGGIMFWGYGLWWLVLAALKTLHYLRGGLPFNLGWWGFTFPLGVYSLATLALARMLHMEFFAVIGGLLVLSLALMWCIVAARTLPGALRRTLFVAPCLAGSETPQGESV